MPGTTRAPLPHIERIAVLRPNAVGDFMFSLPALHALRLAYPQAEIVLLGKQWHVDFLAGRPSPVDRVEVVPPFPGVGAAPDAECDPQAIEAFFARMRAQHFDLALQLYGGGRYANPFTLQLQARLAVGLKAHDAEDLDCSIAYEGWRNHRLQMLEVVALVGADVLRMGPELAVTANDRALAAQAVPQDGRPLALLQPGASDSRRWWPAARFAAVGDALARAGARVAINGNAREAALTTEVAAQMREPSLNLAGKLELNGLCGVLERTQVLVANDTGPLHMGLAIGTPSVGIYWLSNLIEAMPLRMRHHRALLSAQLACPVCGVPNLTTRCAHDVSFVADVPVAEVTRLALKLLHA